MALMMTGDCWPVRRPPDGYVAVGVDDYWIDPWALVLLMFASQQAALVPPMRLVEPRALKSVDFGDRMEQVVPVLFTWSR